MSSAWFPWVPEEGGGTVTLLSWVCLRSPLIWFMYKCLETLCLFPYTHWDTHCDFYMHGDSVWNHLYRGLGRYAGEGFITSLHIISSCMWDILVLQSPLFTPTRRFILLSFPTEHPLQPTQWVSLCLFPPQKQTHKNKPLLLDCLSCCCTYNIQYFPKQWALSLQGFLVLE